MGTFSIEGNAKGNGANPVLVSVAQEAAKSTPYNVTVFSGKRFGGGSSMHDKNQAVDIVLTDPATGAEIPNLKSSIGFPIYEAFAAQMRAAQVKVAPQYSNSFRWGGWFGSTRLNPGGADLMHFDLKSSKLMAGGDWKNGTYPSFRRYVETLGAGMIYSPNGQKPASKTGIYPNLWVNAPPTNEESVPLPPPRPNYDPNNPHNLRPPMDIPSPSDMARAFGAARAIADRQAILDRQPPGERDSIAPLSPEHQRKLSDAAELRAAPSSVPSPVRRPTFAQAQQAILGGTYLRKGAGTKAANAEVQKFLNAQGVTDYKGRALKVDGIIGARTRSAIIAYQINRGLRPDGVVGIKTLADMAAVQEQADNPVTRSQSPEMGGDRFNVAQVIEGQAPGLPGGQSFGEALARQMGAGMAINLASFGGAEGVNYTPAFYGTGYTQMNAGIGSDVGAAARDPFAQLTIDVNDKMGELAAPQTHLADFSQVNSGIGSDAAASARAPFAQLTIDVNNKMREMSGADASGLSSEALQFQADLTPSLGGATGSSLGGTGGATTAVLSNYARTARELAAAKAIQAGRDISLGAPADPFAALRAASLAQNNAFNLASVQAAAQAAAELNAAGGAGGAFTGGGGSQSGGTPSGETRSSAGNTTSTSSGTSPQSGGGASNTVSNPGSMGGSSTSPGTSSSLGGGGTRTGSSSRANP